MSSGATAALSVYDEAIKAGALTAKEKDLWEFVISCYGTDEFSTKQLEKDFGNAAYATIRSFVLKLEKLGLLTDSSPGVASYPSADSSRHNRTTGCYSACRCAGQDPRPE